MFYLIGVDHDVQHDGHVNRLPKDRASDIRKRFQRFIESVVRKEKAQIIAEVGCHEVWLLLEATTTMAKLAAERLGIEHRFIEPCGVERERLGIPSGSYAHLPEAQQEAIYKLREQFWFRSLEDVSFSPIVVVCGARHVSSFSELLSTNGKDFTIVDAAWGKEFMPARHVFNQS